MTVQSGQFIKELETRMTNKKRIKELEIRKIQLIRNIDICDSSKKKIILFVRRLSHSYNNNKISSEEYYAALDKVLKGRTEKQWLDYYDECIAHYRLSHDKCEREIKEASKLNLIPIILILSLIIITGIFFIRPAIMGLTIYEPGEIIDKTIMFNISKFVPNTSIIELTLENQSSTLPITKFLVEQTILIINNETTYGFNISNISINSLEFGLITPTIPGNYSLISTIINNETILATNITEIIVGTKPIEQVNATEQIVNESIEVNITNISIIYIGNESFELARHDNPKLPKGLFIQADGQSDKDDSCALEGNWELINEGYSGKGIMYTMNKDSIGCGLKLPSLKLKEISQVSLTIKFKANFTNPDTYMELINYGFDNCNIGFNSTNIIFQKECTAKLTDLDNKWKQLFITDWNITQPAEKISLFITRPFSFINEKGYIIFDQLSIFTK